MNKPDELAGPKGGDESRRLAKHWLDQINAVKDNAEHKRWVKRSESIIKRYRDERSRVDEDGQRRYNALWANVEVLKPAFYGKTPLPVAERRFKDKDPTGRNAAQILERGLRNEIEICGFTDAMTQAVSDYLLPGRGTVWVRYEPEIEESVSLPPEPQTDVAGAEEGDTKSIETDDEHQPKRKRPTLNDDDDEHEPEEGEQDDSKPDEAEQKLMDTGDRVVRESTPVDFVPWDDFFSFPIRARNWAEVTAVAKRVYMSRNQMKKRFGDEIGKKIPLQKDDRGDKTQNTTLQAQEQDKGQVYEIWDKEEETVYWVAQGFDYLADLKEDPLELEFFFPCPKPLYANPTTNTLVPVPDYIQYQDQAIQIDELTQRISMLAKACKVAGVYNAAAKDIQRLLNESVENELIPVDDWAAFAGEKGGVAGNMSLLPVQDIIGVINELMMVKQKQIEEMDRLTGINDIMRGTSDPRETLGGVRLKSNSSGTRLTSRQNEVARFARDTLRIMADIMARHFSPQSLIEVSGALYEEGLGPKDMPSLTAMQEAQEQKPPAPPPQNGPGPSPPQATGPGGAPPPPPSQSAPPPPPQGGNVVPFRPPGGPPGAPPGPPGAPPQPGAQPGPPAPPPMPVPPPLPPEVQAKIDALQRISGALKLLRDERLRGFRVDIEVDSTIYGDQAQDKQDRNEFVVATTQYLQQAMMLGAQMPEAVPLLGKLLSFGARGHKIGRDLELAIEEFTEEAAIIAKQKAQQAQNKPSPEEQQAQLEMMKAQVQLQMQQSKAQSDQMRNQAEMQSTQMKSQAEGKQAQAEVERQGIENQGNMMSAQAEQQKAASDMQMQQMQQQIEQIKLQIEFAKLKAMGEQTQQTMHATQQSQQATQQTQHQGATDLAQEQERTKQVADQEHTKRVVPQPVAPAAAPAGGKPHGQPATPAPSTHNR